MPEEEHEENTAAESARANKRQLEQSLASNMTPGQQRWSHYAKNKKPTAVERLLTRKNSSSVTTIKEDSEEKFEEEFQQGGSASGARGQQQALQQQQQLQHQHQHQHQQHPPIKKRSSFSRQAPSGFVPPTRVAGAPDRAVDEKIKTVRPDLQRVGGQSSSSKGLLSTRSLDAGALTYNSQAPTGYIPPTRVTGPSPDKPVDGKLKSSREDLLMIRSTYSRNNRSASTPEAGSNRSRRSLKRDVVTPPSTSVPPVSRSVDILPGGFPQGSNIVMDDTVSQVTDHSASTARIRNTNQGQDDRTIHTTSTMATEQVRNRVQARGIALNPRDIAALSPSAPDTQDTSEHGRIGRRADSGVRRGSLQRPVRMVMDDQGHTMSNQEIRELWERSGKCVECGLVQTHQKQKYGIFGVLRRMQPQTVEAISYKGYCLRCHDVHDLRRLLRDPNIPLDLPRQDPMNSSIRSLQSTEASLLELSRKRSPLLALFGSLRFQVFLGILLLGVAGALVGTAIHLAKGPEPWVPPPPTSAPSEAPSTSFPSVSPTSKEWNLAFEIRREDIVSFGNKVALSGDGLLLAVTAPKYDGKRGRLDIFKDPGDGTGWLSLGDAIVGEEPSDMLGHSMDLSGDGTAVAVGAPDTGPGRVQVFSIDQELGLVQKGQIISSPAALFQFGYSVALSFDGNRLIVSAPQFAKSVDEVVGMVQAFDFDGQQWVQVGRDIIGPSHGSRFGHSISCDDSGNRLVVGAPLDDELYYNGGQIFWYELEGVEWVDVLQPVGPGQGTIANDNVFVGDNKIQGSEEGSHLGRHVRLSSGGKYVISGLKSNYIERDVANAAGTISIHVRSRISYEGVQVLTQFPGTREGAKLGYDAFVSASADIAIVSGENNGGNAGSVAVFENDGLTNYYLEGHELFGPQLGENEWVGAGPSLGVAATTTKRVAIGYESILSNGVSHSCVRIYDLYGVTDYNPANR